MLSPILVVSTDDVRNVLVITIEGPFTDPAHADTLRTVVPTVPAEFGLLVDLSWVERFSNDSTAALCAVVRDAGDAGVRVTVVCANIERRAELIVAGLDRHAAVVASIEQALPAHHRAA